MTTTQERKSMLTQTIDKIITQKIEEADCNIKPDQAINKLLIQEIGKGFKTYIEKLDQDYDSELRLRQYQPEQTIVKNENVV